MDERFAGAGMEQVATRAPSYATGQKSGQTMDAPNFEQGMGFLGDHGRRKEASSSSSQEGCGTLEASGHRSGMAELARRPFAEEAVEASDKSGFVEMEGKICFTAYCGAAGAGVRSMYMQIHVRANTCTCRCITCTDHRLHSVCTCACGRRMAHLPRHLRSGMTSWFVRERRERRR